MAAVSNFPGPSEALPRPSSVFHDAGRRDLAIQTGSMILLITLVGFLLADGMARRDIGPPVPASLSGVVLAAPQPTADIDLGDDVQLMGRWTLVCWNAATCANAAAAMTDLPGMPVQVIRSGADPANLSYPLVDPRGRVYAKLDGSLPRLDLRGLVLEIQNYFDREVLARLF